MNNNLGGRSITYCLIAVDKKIEEITRNNLKQFFPDWIFETCTDANALKEYTEKNVDVVALSRTLPGVEPKRLLQQLRALFPSAHIVLMVGDKTTESCKAYIRAAAKAGLNNVVTGSLPGDRPYTLMVALKRPRNPELDGYTDLGEIEDEDDKNSDGVSIGTKPMESRYEDDEAERPAVPLTVLNSPRMPQGNDGMNGLVVVSTANKGGIGKTTTAIYVSMALAMAGISTVLVDMDLGAPDVASFFDIKDVPGIERLAGQGDINPAQIDRLLINRDNLSILPGVMNKTLPRYSSGELAGILSYLKQKYTVVVCDTSPEPWTKRWLYEVFEISDLALAVVDQSKFSEEETKKYGPTLLAMGLTPERIRVVVNRFNPQLHNLRVVEAAFNSGFKKTCKVLPRIGAVINDDRNKIEKAAYKGVVAGLEDPKNPWHKLSKEIAELAGYRYERAGGERQSKNTGGRGLLGIFGRKS